MENWVIAKCNSDGDGIELKQFVGTEDEAKELLAKMAADDASENCDEDDDLEYGTEDASEVSKDCFGSLYAYRCFCDYHIDYTARRLSEIYFTK